MAFQTPSASNRLEQAGDFDRRVVAVRQEADKHGPNAVPQYMICGLCTALHKEATGRYPYRDDGTN